MFPEVFVEIAKDVSLRAAAPLRYSNNFDICRGILVMSFHLANRYFHSHDECIRADSWEQNHRPRLHAPIGVSSYASSLHPEARSPVP